MRAAATAWYVQLSWTAALIGAVVTGGIAVVSGVGSIGLVGEACKHGDCDNGSDRWLRIAGLLGVAFAVLFVAWLVLRAKAKAAADASE